MKKNPADKVESWPIDKLVPYARNARTHSDAQVAQLAASITEWGWTTPILVEPAGGVIAGHGRLMAARKLGMTHVPVMVADGWSEAQRRAYVLADNKLALTAGWDDELLQLELGELGELGFDLELAGFSLDDIEPTKVEPQGDPDETPEPPAKPKSVPGDVWILGAHRVMCGDSTSVEAVERLMDGAKADMVFTDPPYGIAHSGKGITTNNAEGNDFGKILGDDDVTVAIDAFNLSAANWPDARMIFWGANYYPSVLPDGHGWLVWDKQRESDTFSGAELAFINGGIRVDVFRHMWHGMIKASEHGQKRVHPTQKPIALAEWCFERYGNPKCVVDLFGGSGSTLIACEKSGRVCRAMELDPRYVDVIVKRWQDYTGKKATHAESGKTFDEVS